MLSSISGFSQLSGTVTVGSAMSNDYQCLTCDSGLFKALNDSGTTGNVEVLITSSLMGETAEIDLKEYKGTHAISIKPASAGLKTVSFPADSNDILLNLDSVVNLTIDGSFNGSGRHLAFVSLDSINPAIQIVRDCKNIRIANCVIRSNNTSSSGVLGGAINLRSFGSTGNDNVVLENNVIERASTTGKLAVGVFVNGVNNSTETASGLQVLKNEFVSCQQFGLIMEPSTGHVGPTLIKANSFYTTSNISGPNNLTPLSAIYINTGENHQIIGNYIGGQSAKCGGAKMSVLLSDFSSQVYFIRIGSGVLNNKTIEVDSNTIKNIQVFGSSAAGCQVHIFHVHANVKPKISFGTKHGNFIGDVNVDASTSGNSSIWFQERFNSASNFFKIFNLLGTNDIDIIKSSIGGIHLSQVNAKGSQLEFIHCEDATNLLVDSNIIGVAKNNIVKKSDGMFRLLNSDANSTITNNQITGITNNGDFSDFFLIFDLYSSGKSIKIKDNTIGNLLDDASVDAAIKTSSDKLIPKAFKIVSVAGNSVKSLEVTGNQVGSIHISASGALKKVDFTAIDVRSPNTSQYVISNNTIGSGVSNNILQESDGKIFGIVIEGPGKNVKIENNRINGISGKSYFSNSFTGIEITGNAIVTSTVLVKGNIIGDTSKNAASSPAIDLGGGSLGIAPSSYALQSVSRIDVLKIENNAIGGIKTTSGGEEVPYISFLIGDVKDTFHLKNNQIGSRLQVDNMFLGAPDNFAYQVYLSNPDGNKEVVVANNLFSNITYSGAFNSSVQVLRSTNGTALGSVLIKNNQFRNFKMGTGGDKVNVKMIYSSNNTTTVDNNLIENVVISSTYPGIQFEGVNIDESGSDHEINLNTISKVRLISTSAFEGSATGISIFGAASNFSVGNNLITKFDMLSTSDKSSFKGILVNSCVSASITNNVILYRNAGGSISPTGIYDFANTGSLDIFHNSVDLAGALPNVASIFSTCYLKNNDATRKISNNFFNNRTSGGQRPHYAVYFGTSTGSIGCDFNLLYSEQNRDKVVFYTDNLDMTAWQSKGFGLKSVNPIAQNLIDSLTGKQLTKLGNDVGLTNVGINTDFAGASRPQDAGFDMGAFEIATATLADGKLPPVAPISVRENELKKSKIYPNPAHDVLNVDFIGNEEIEIAVYTISGIVKIEAALIPGLNKIDLDELESGYYFLSTGAGTTIPFSVIK